MGPLILSVVAHSDEQQVIDTQVCGGAPSTNLCDREVDSAKTSRPILFEIPLQAIPSVRETLGRETFQ